MWDYKYSFSERSCLVLCGYRLLFLPGKFLGLEWMDYIVGEHFNL